MYLEWNEGERIRRGNRRGSRRLGYGGSCSYREISVFFLSKIGIWGGF